MRSILLLLFLLPLATIGQVAIQNNLLATAGEAQINANIQLDYSFGEVFTSTFDNGSYVETQGFQQPYRVRRAGNAVNQNNSAYLFEVDFGTVKVYPNPTMDFLYIELTGKTNLHVQLIDIMGRVVEVFELNNFINEIDLRSYENGTYQLVIWSDVNNITRLPIVKAN